MRVRNAVLVAGCLCLRVSSAQEFLDQMNFKASQLTGVHLLGVSVFGGYSTSALPIGEYAAAPLAGGGYSGRR